MLRIRLFAAIALAVTLFAAPRAWSQQQVLFAVSASGKTINEYQLDGTFIKTLASTPGSGLLQDVAVKDGIVYVSSYQDSKIYRFRLDGTQLSPFSVDVYSPPDPALKPNGLVFDAAGNLLVSCEGHDRGGLQIGHLDGYIFRIKPDGTVLQPLAKGLINPDAMVFDNSGNLYVTDSSPSLPSGIKEFDATGNLIRTIAMPSDYLLGLCWDKAGELLVSRYFAGTIERFSATGDDLGLFASGLSHPYGMSSDAAGNVYVANNGTSEIVRIGPNGGAYSPIASYIDVQSPTVVTFSSPTDTTPEPGASAIIVAAMVTCMCTTVRRRRYKIPTSIQKQ